MVSMWVLAGSCLLTALVLRFNLCWQAVHRPVGEHAAPSQVWVPLDRVPDAVTRALEPFDLATTGFACLGVLESTLPTSAGFFLQIWLDPSKTLVGSVILDSRRPEVTCHVSFVSYGYASSAGLFGVGVSSRPVTQLPRYSLGGRRMISSPGRSQQELLQLHVRQRSAQPVQPFVRIESMVAFLQVQDAIHDLNHRRALDSGVVARGADGQLWLSGRVTVLAALRSMAPLRLRLWTVRFLTARQIRRWLATSAADLPGAVS